MFNQIQITMKRVMSLLVGFSLFSWILLVYGCKKDPVIPTLTTTVVSGVTLTEAISGGNVTNDGRGDITSKGVCWNTTGDPTITDSKTTDGPGSGSFTSTLTSLQPAIKYYVRAYATNSAGTAYGEQFSFNTRFADIDGNQYNTVTVGSKVWMAENLKTTKFTDNALIPNISGNASWMAATTAGYCWYANNEATYKLQNGALYNWYAVNSGKLCPTGWRVPTDAEFNSMELNLGLTQTQVDTYGWRGTNQGAQLKNTSGWNAGENGTNTSGFSAIPSGYRYYTDGTFSGTGILGYWWSSTQYTSTDAWYRRLDGNNSGIYKGTTSKKAGKAVRCIKN